MVAVEGVLFDDVPTPRKGSFIELERESLPLACGEALVEMGESEDGFPQTEKGPLISPGGMPSDANRDNEESLGDMVLVLLAPVSARLRLRSFMFKGVGINDMGDAREVVASGGR